MMSHDQLEMYRQLKSFIIRNNWQYAERDEPHSRRFDIQDCNLRCVAKVFVNGNTQIQGPKSRLKDTLDRFKLIMANNKEIESESIPVEAEGLPFVLKRTIPNIDSTLVDLFSESIRCFKTNSIIGCSYLLGSASERAIWLMIHSYYGTKDQGSVGENLKHEVSNKSVSLAFNEFLSTLQHQENGPEAAFLHDLEDQLCSIFQLWQACRNGAGQPHINPDLDKGTLLSNIGQFVTSLIGIYNISQQIRFDKVKS